MASWSTQLFKEEQDCQFLKKWWNAAAATNRSPPRQSSSLYYSCMLDLKNILVVYPAWESELHFHLWATDGKTGGLGRAEGGVGRHVIVDALGLRGQGARCHPEGWLLLLFTKRECGIVCSLKPLIFFQYIFAAIKFLYKWYKSYIGHLSWSTFYCSYWTLSTVSGFLSSSCFFHLC